MNALAENTSFDKVDLASYIRLDANGRLMVNLSEPRAIPVLAVNPLTGETKNYMLRVTSKGTLCIV